MKIKLLVNEVEIYDLDSYIISYRFKKLLDNLRPVGTLKDLGGLVISIDELDLTTDFLWGLYDNKLLKIPRINYHLHLEEYHRMIYLGLRDTKLNGFFPQLALYHAARSTNPELVINTEDSVQNILNYLKTYYHEL